MASKKLVKQDLRFRIGNLLRALTEQEIKDQSHNVFEALKKLPEYQRASRMSIYLPIAGREISTKEIICDAFDHGKTIFAPYLHRDANINLISFEKPRMIMEMLQMKSKEEVETYKPDRWGIPTMSTASVSTRKNCLGGTGVDREKVESHSDMIGLDMIILPGVAFDHFFGRLGHGKGFYDYFLDEYQRSVTCTSLRMPRLVAVALNEQLLSGNESVPLEANDWRMDVIITGSGDILRSNVNESD